MPLAEFIMARCSLDQQSTSLMIILHPVALRKAKIAYAILAFLSAIGLKKVVSILMHFFHSFNIQDVLLCTKVASAKIICK